jgi:hypothetical protein
MMLAYGFEAVTNSIKKPYLASTDRGKRAGHTEKDRHLEIMPVILSEAKDLVRRTQRSFAEFTLERFRSFAAAQDDKAKGSG